MRSALESLLLARYPGLFPERTGFDASTPLPPIFHEIGAGWFAIIDALCSALNTVDPGAQIKHIRARQNAFRVVCRPTHAATYGAIHTAQSFSSRICKLTGHPRISHHAAANTSTMQTASVKTKLTSELPPGLSDLLNLGFQSISKSRPRRTDRPIIHIDTASWNSSTGLIVTPSVDSIRILTLAQIRTAKTSGNRLPYPGSAPQYTARILNRANAAAAFLNQMSQRIDLQNGRCGPVNDHGRLIQT